jgi:hypothetical protein
MGTMIRWAILLGCQRRIRGHSGDAIECFQRVVDLIKLACPAFEKAGIARNDLGPKPSCWAPRFS